jgi:SAM-dependent methyltransferase
MTMFDQPAWEERYGSADRVWSGRPNAQLIAEASDLTPGTALDVGCGEGADAIWLAARGWRVIAVDFATTALRRAAGHAETEGAEVAGRIEWTHADLRVWTPPVAGFDLVSAQYMHLPPAERRDLFSRLAAAVAPGGALLIVGHDISDIEAGAHRPDMPEMFFTVDEVVGSLDAEHWEVVTAEARPRPGHVHEGQDITVHDAVIRARRMAP